MHVSSISRASLVVFVVAAATACAAKDEITRNDSEAIRQVERKRLRALVDADIEAARQMHSDDFQLVNPAGMPLSREAYLGALTSARLDYIAWEPGDIAVRFYGNAAVIRYRDARFDVDSEGRALHRGPMYHTNVYERRDGRWQAVWSQASGIITPP